MANLKILNLNIMHGRNARSSVFPLVTKKAEVKETLGQIAGIISHHDPDIVTLQEVDGYSLFNGRLNQLSELSQQLHYPYWHLSDNFKVSLSGTTIHRTGVALLSRYPLISAVSHNFAATFPTPRKGFCVAQVKLDNILVTVASVHMVWRDWLKRNSRLHQAQLLADTLRTQPRPLVVAGDFNCQLVGTEERTLPILLEALDLQAFAPENRTMNTWPSWQPTERDDWILISRECQFLTHETFNDQHSDHLAIAATVKIPG